MPRRAAESPTEEDEEEAAILASLAPAIGELQACWQTAALAQFYRCVVGSKPGSNTASAESLERTLAAGEETTLVGMMLPLLGLGDDANAAACWAAVAQVLESGMADFTPASGDHAGDAHAPPPTSFGALAPADRARLLYALADASLADATSVAGSSSQFTAEDPTSMRGERLGIDSAYRIYWHLGCARIYREVPPKPQKASVKKAKKAKGEPAATTAWEVCATESTNWREMMSKLKKKGVVSTPLEASLARAVHPRNRLEA